MVNERETSMGKENREGKKDKKTPHEGSEVSKK